MPLLAPLNIFEWDSSSFKAVKLELISWQKGGIVQHCEISTISFNPWRSREKNDYEEISGSNQFPNLLHQLSLFPRSLQICEHHPSQTQQIFGCVSQVLDFGMAVGLKSPCKVNSWTSSYVLRVIFCIIEHIWHRQFLDDWNHDLKCERSSSQFTTFGKKYAPNISRTHKHSCMKLGYHLGWITGLSNSRCFCWVASTGIFSHIPFN